MLAKSVLVVLLAQKSQFQKIVRLWPSSTRFSSQLLLRRTGFLLAMRRHLSQERCACTAAGGERQMSKCPSKAPARGTRHVVTALRKAQVAEGVAQRTRGAVHALGLLVQELLHRLVREHGVHLVRRRLQPRIPLQPPSPSTAQDRVSRSGLVDSS